MDALQAHFEPFRRKIIGHDHRFRTPFGEVPLVYADWTASGRMYGPIEQRILENFGPLVGNTHSESSLTGTTMTHAYHLAHRTIKEHVNAGPDDVIITAGTGMTGVACKFQRILGLRVPEQMLPYLTLDRASRPVVFITHMEHHSNHTSWLETIADVEVIPPDENGAVDPDRLESLLQKHRARPLKIGSFTACSNVTGLRPPIQDLARLMHRYGGLCFVDFAASAPYVEIDMHPPDPEARLDAIFFSPHKFLGGPGSPGVLIFDAHLYQNRVPDHPGGGTVNWTNPWGDHLFIRNIEVREDGGTPGFLQAIRAALAIRLKEEMGVEAMIAREESLLPRLFGGLRGIPGLHILADHFEHRLGILSFHVEGVHYNLMVRLLNDRFGIQVRGGCSCAGTYGHYLLHISPRRSRQIMAAIDRAQLTDRPGWVRLSIHPTTTDDEAEYILDAIRACVRNAREWGEAYDYQPTTNEFRLRDHPDDHSDVERWFSLS